MVRLTRFLEAELSLSGCVIWHKGKLDGVPACFGSSSATVEGLF